MKRELKDVSFIPINWGTGNDLTMILDTNVLNYMLIPDAMSQINVFLQRFKEVENIKPEFKIIKTISSVSIYECLQGNNQDEYINLFKGFKCYEIDMDVQYIAAQLKVFYTKHGIKINDIPDLYISSTAMLNASSILTANQSDYPDILFKEVMAKNIQWKEKNRTKNVMLYLLRPDYNKAKEKKFFKVME